MTRLFIWLEYLQQLERICVTPCRELYSECIESITQQCSVYKSRRFLKHRYIASLEIQRSRRFGIHESLVVDAGAVNATYIRLIFYGTCRQQLVPCVNTHFRPVGHYEQSVVSIVRITAPYREADIVPCVFNGIPDVSLVLLEKNLSSAGRI